tara:strand:- start:341 stop:496 length:156 start_codon:yes stop_codon:yes gene_type:complete
MNETKTTKQTNNAAETLREIMAAYNTNRAAWIAETGSEAGFDKWFYDQIYN